MKGPIHGALLIICLAVANGLTCRAQTNPPMPGPPAMVGQVLSWLPADTETIFVTNKQFTMPGFKKRDASKLESEYDWTEVFELLPVSFFLLRDGLLQNYLMGQRVELAIEGSRHFRAPASLGGMPYEGCQIAVLAEAVAGRGDSFVKQLPDVGLKLDNLAGETITVFEQKLESDIWTIYVAFPKPNLVLACTNRDYLRDVLERIGGKAGQRALDERLPEWKYVGTAEPFWGLRHYDRSQAGRDPTSPFVDRNVLGFADGQASGIAFRFDPGKGNVGTISYFSNTRDILGFLERQTPLSMKGLVDPTIKVPVRYREVTSGVAEVEYELGDALPVSLFLFVVVSVLGHGIYL